MAETVLINGEFNDKLSCLDRGLHYGDGVFETIAVFQQKLLCWDDHLERLRKGCNCLGIPVPDESILFEESNTLITNIDRGVLKLIITRGQGGRGYGVPDKTDPTRIVALYPWPNHPDSNTEQGINVRYCQFRYSQNPSLAGIKHLNRLEQVLARSEWNDKNIQEGLVMDIDNNIIEGTMSNVFYVKEKSLFTPALEQCGIEGIIRKIILDICPELKIPTHIKNISPEELFNADEVFVCNSVIGIWPVKKLKEKKYLKREITEKLTRALIERNMIVPLC